MHKRDLRLDFFRGLALWFIFLDHIPGNALSWLTIRNYGFSDATEIFVFISGFATASAYGGDIDLGGMGIAAARILRRCWQLYVAHIFLFVLYTAQIAYVAATFDNPLFADEMNVSGFIDDPPVTLVQAMLLKFRPANMDVLPLYIVLLLTFPPVLWLMRRWPAGLLAGSLGLWWAADAFDLNLPIWPDGRGWMFNPLAWQLMFILGGLAATWPAWRAPALRLRPALTAAALLYLAFALIVALSWKVPRLELLIPDTLQKLMYPIDKTNLSPLRIAHFLALAWLVSQLVPRSAAFLTGRLARPLLVTGQHSLEVFCLGTVAAFTAQFLRSQWGDSLPHDIVLSLAGLVLMTGLGAYMSWYQVAEARLRHSKGATR